jgi:hypothetical protein
VCGEVSDRVVDLCTRVDDALRMVREAREMYAILLTLQLLCVLAFLAVVDLEGVVVACYDGKLARVVEVEGGDRCCARTRRFEALEVLSIYGRSLGIYEGSLLRVESLL